MRDSANSRGRCRRVARAATPNVSVAASNNMKPTPRTSHVRTGLVAGALALHGLAQGPQPATPVPAARLAIVVAAAGQPGMSVDSIADLTGDSIRDVLVGLPGLDVVQIRNGRNGNLVATINGPMGTEFGHEVASIGDINGDGREEIAVGAVGANGDGTVFVFGYFGGGVFPLRSWTPSVPSSASFPSRYGWSITRLGDLTGDGIEEVAVGAPFHDRGIAPLGYYGLVDVVNPAPLTPTYLSTLIGTAVYEEIGDSLATLGDLDGDGRRELVIGASRQAWGGTLPGQAPGIARVYSGLSLAFGAPLQMLQVGGLFNFDTFGTAVANIGDVNADGLDEWVVGAPDVADTNGSFVRAYNGAATAAGNPTPGYTVSGPAPTERHFGWSLTGGIGDLSGDGKPDFLVGAPVIFGGTGIAGAAYIVNGRTSGIVYSLSASGASPTFGYDVSEHATFAGGKHWLIADPGAGTLFMF
jgi:hypothetical protein